MKDIHKNCINLLSEKEKENFIEIIHRAKRAITRADAILTDIMIVYFGKEKIKK